MQNPIFIVGLHRTGSSLLTNIFRKNPNILIFEEMHFLSLWRKDFRYINKKYVKNIRNLKSTKKLVELFFSKEKVAGLNTPFWRYFQKHPGEKKLKNILIKNIYNSDKSLESIFKIIVEDIPGIAGKDILHQGPETTLEPGGPGLVQPDVQDG